MTDFAHLDDEFFFGRYYGCTLCYVLIYNPEYIHWVVSNVSGEYCKIQDTAIEEIKLMFPDFIMSAEFESNRLLQLEYQPVIEDTEEDRYADFDAREYEDIPTYDRYGGSYAQDVEGYSDDEIDTIFDGDPSAYWNID